MQWEYKSARLSQSVCISKQATAECACAVYLTAPLILDQWTFEPCSVNMLSMFSPMSLEAQKLITVSIGKINASRVTRTGTSLHRSLLVASVLQKARNVYLEEERERATRYPPPPSPELTVTPICQQQTYGNGVVVSIVNNNATPSTEDDARHNDSSELACHPEDEVVTPGGEESRLPATQAAESSTPEPSPAQEPQQTFTTNTITTSHSCGSNSLQPRKRRRVSDQETAAAISSILPKRLRSELRDDPTSQDCTNFTPTCTEVTDSPKLLERLSATPPSEEETTSSPEETAGPVSPTSSDESDSDSEESTDSASDTSSTGSEEEMEVDQLTSLVSYFSFTKSQQNCIGSSLHSSSGGPHIVALTA